MSAVEVSWWIGALLCFSITVDLFLYFFCHFGEIFGGRDERQIYGFSYLAFWNRKSQLSPVWFSFLIVLCLIAVCTVVDSNFLACVVIVSWTSSFFFFFNFKWNQMSLDLLNQNVDVLWLNNQIVLLKLKWHSHNI